MIEPLRLTVEVGCDARHAFSVWTERIAAWWPPLHSVSGDADLEVVLEPRLGGRIFERLPSGTEIDWGEITLWEPPSRLGYLWHLRRDRAEATDVEIVFVDRGDGTALVEIEHRGWERLGAEGQAWRDRNRSGWGGMLPHFTAYAESVV
jgi:Activator of Hsp90 ATPase homolog 1-like protein